jgi:hypothetical protein
MKNQLLFVALSLFSISLNAQSVISSSTTFSQTDADTYSWPISISGGTSSDPVVVTLGEDILLEQTNKYFIIESEYVLFDGNNKTVTIDNVSGYPGLFQAVSGYSNISINNTKVLSNSSTLQNDGGWIGQSNFAIGASNVIISNCYSDGDAVDFGGCITGSSSSCAVINSHSSGSTSWASGGIFGAYSTGTAINCYSTGNGVDYCGGIFGYDCSGSAVDCYSTGTIGYYCGGIFGYDSYGSASRCYSTGGITSYGAGGIAGAQNYGTIDNCYSTGNVSSDAGGITGPDNGGSITNCYSTGIIDAGGGGVAGNSNYGTITNSFAEDGVWNDANAVIYLTGEDGTIWTDIDLSTDNVPYKLTSFNTNLYDPNTESKAHQAVINSPTGNFATGNYSIISINDDAASLVPSITINATSGVIDFDNTPVGSFTSKILYADNDDGSYSISSYTLNVLGILPLTWRSFTVTPRNNAAWLQWSTSSEQNTRDFNVQYSIDGRNWTTIGTVTAAGNSNSISNYSYVHTDPVAGNNFYRIQQTDLDSRYSYSSIQKLQIGFSNKSFSVLNNIINNTLLQVDVKTPALLYLYSNDGKLVWQKQFDAGLQNIELSVPRGVYFLKGKDAVEKILVQ